MLDGLRVLDLGPGIAPSFCAKLLADYGAEVIKVEPPGPGDPARAMGPFVGDDPHPEKSIPFLYLNTGKRGVTLDYSGESGRADVLVEGVPPRQAEQPGHCHPERSEGSMAPPQAQHSAISYQQLSYTHPHLVVTSVTLFGQDGPYRDFQATDIITCAMNGIVTGRREVNGVGHADCAVTLTNSRGHQTASGVGSAALPRRGQQLPLVWESGE